ncbi:MAG: hypothetical protein KatS3mg089_0174 [Patescibacteria group bacterium]|nr:MAG: hypothetical protein KatS3mg089_0174 [Patescibacteria group bacterium]
MASLPHEFSLPFWKKEQVADQTYSFYFLRTEKIDFKPGQYIKMTLDLTEEDPRGNSRFFSLCSSPLEEELIMITTKIADVPSPFKKKLLSLTPNESVKFFGPAGVFVLPEQSARPVILLAGGIGITPFHSMILYASVKKCNFFITLIASFSTVEEAVFYQELQDAAALQDNLKVIYTISHPERSQQKWDGAKGRISEEMIRKYVAHPKEALFYICGPMKMVDSMLELIKGMGVPQGQIKKENFTGY